MNVYKKIAEVTGFLSREGIGKDRNNQQQGYKFRGIDDVYNALSKHLASVGLCILPRIIERECVERQSSKGGALFYVIVTAEFDVICAEDGSKHTIRTYGEAMDSADKATNKAMSAAYKYACFQMFCIPTDGDNDADATTHNVSKINWAARIKSCGNKAALRDLYAEAGRDGAGKDVLEQIAKAGAELPE